MDRRTHLFKPGVAPPTAQASAVRRETAAMGLQGLASGIGNHRFALVVSRAVDTSKAEPIRNELNSRWWVSNSTLEKLWASLGTGLPHAVEDPAYQDLWQTSIKKEGISVTNAARPLLGVLARDVMSTASTLVGSQVARLEALQKDLEEAKKQKHSAAAPVSSQPPTGVEDEASKTSRAGKPPPAPEPFGAVRTLVDSASMLHFMRNWRDILRTAEIGIRTFDNAGLLPIPAPENRPAGWTPLPNSPDRVAATTPGAPPAAAPADAHVPLRFDPTLTLDQTLKLGFVDVDAFEAVRSTFTECEKQQATLDSLAAEMMAADANLAVLAERGLIADVSALSMQTDATAADRMLSITKENAASAKKLHNMITGNQVDWKALRPVYGALLAGQLGGSTNWSDKPTKSFVTSWMEQQDKAAIEAQQRQAIIETAFTAAAFIAMLTPLSPLGAALMGASQAYFATMAVAGAAEADRAQQRAEMMGTAAAAGVADKEDAARAKKEADDRQATMVVNLVMSALPYLPAIAKGAGKGIAALGREFRWSSAGKVYGGTPSAIAAQAAYDFVVDLGKAGVSAVAKARAGGRLSLNQMVSRIKQINREVDWVKVTAALARGGEETQLHPLSVYGLQDYIRYHIHGPGTGLEGFPILAAPVKANQFANHYIEGPMRAWVKDGLHVEFRASFATFSGDEMRGFIEGLLRQGDKQILNRLALDQGLMEKFLKSITYDIRVWRAGKIEFYRANITVGAPGSGMQPVFQKPVLLSTVPAPPGPTSMRPPGR